ncbi:MAG: heme-binding protein [Pseudomonadota bacterium]
MISRYSNLTKLAFIIGTLSIAGGASAGAPPPLPAGPGDCSLLEAELGVGAGGTPGALQARLDATNVDAATNGGFGLDMWGTIVNRDGFVCAVAHTGANRGEQWPASRAISAQKASTANSLSLPGLALSTANLYASAQPGGSLFGVQFSNPVDAAAAYAGDPTDYGMPADPMVGNRVGGHNVFGGGFALYGSDGALLGGLGVSGDTSCKDHNYGWQVRNALGLDFVPGGISGDPARPDNIVYDMKKASRGKIKSKSAFGHVDCGLGEKAISETLPPVSVVAP